MWKIIEDLKSLEIKATHHKEILDEIYEELLDIKFLLTEFQNLTIVQAKNNIQKVLDKLEDM